MKAMKMKKAIKKLVLSLAIVAVSTVAVQSASAMEVVVAQGVAMKLVGKASAIFKRHKVKTALAVGVVCALCLSKPELLSKCSAALGQGANEFDAYCSGKGYDFVNTTEQFDKCKSAFGQAEQLAGDCKAFVSDPELLNKVGTCLTNCHTAAKDCYDSNKGPVEGAIREQFEKVKSFARGDSSNQLMETNARLQAELAQTHEAINATQSDYLAQVNKSVYK